MLPSEEHAIEMYSMDFEEFLWAMDDEMLMPYIRHQFEHRQPMGVFHRRALDYFRQYLIVGGMPQAVAKYVEDRMEIDFLISKAVTTSRHNISPIEVKSGKRYAITSLKKCIAKYGNQLSTPYVLHDKDLKEEDGIIYLPLYMTPLL